MSYRQNSDADPSLPHSVPMRLREQQLTSLTKPSGPERPAGQRRAASKRRRRGQYGAAAQSTSPASHLGERSGESRCPSTNAEPVSMHVVDLDRLAEILNRRAQEGFRVVQGVEATIKRSELPPKTPPGLRRTANMEPYRGVLFILEREVGDADPASDWRRIPEWSPTIIDFIARGLRQDVAVQEEARTAKSAGETRGPGIPRISAMGPFAGSSQRVDPSLLFDHTRHRSIHPGPSASSFLAGYGCRRVRTSCGRIADGPFQPERPDVRRSPMVRSWRPDGHRGVLPGAAPGRFAFIHRGFPLASQGPGTGWLCNLWAHGNGGVRNGL